MDLHSFWADSVLAIFSEWGSVNIQPLPLNEGPGLYHLKYRYLDADPDYKIHADLDSQNLEISNLYNMLVAFEESL